MQQGLPQLQETSLLVVLTPHEGHHIELQAHDVYTSLSAATKIIERHLGAASHQEKSLTDSKKAARCLILLRAVISCVASCKTKLL